METQTPFFLDFVVTLPESVRIEAGVDTRDCVTWGESGCDDD